MEGGLPLGQPQPPEDDEALSAEVFERRRDIHYSHLLDASYGSFADFNRSLNWLASGAIIATYLVIRDFAIRDGISLPAVGVVALFALGGSLFLSVVSMLSAAEAHRSLTDQFPKNTHPDMIGKVGRATDWLNKTAIVLLAVGLILVFTFIATNLGRESGASHELPQSAEVDNDSR
jgi:hypothetical protein